MTTIRAFLARVIGGVALVAAMALIWQSEWQLALAVGWPPEIAWAAPAALDAYLLAAVLADRDVGSAILVSAASVVISHTVYATPEVWASGVVGDGKLLWWAAALFSAVPLLVAWRVHHLVASPVVVAPARGARVATVKTPEKAREVRVEKPPAPSRAVVAAPQVVGAPARVAPQPRRVTSGTGTPTARVIAEEVAALCRTVDDVAPQTLAVLDVADYDVAPRTADRVRKYAREIVSARVAVDVIA